MHQGKRLTFGMMGRKGFEDKRKEIETVKKDSRYILYCNSDSRKNK